MTTTTHTAHTNRINTVQKLWAISKQVHKATPNSQGIMQTRSWLSQHNWENRTLDDLVTSYAQDCTQPKREHNNQSKATDTRTTRTTDNTDTIIADGQAVPFNLIRAQIELIKDHGASTVAAAIKIANTLIN